MIQLKNCYFIFLFMLLSLKGQNIGSDTTVERFNSQVILTQGDRIATFAAIEDGFAFFDTSTTATYDSFFNASGNFAFNQGTLKLETDLIFSEISAWQTLGSIDGNNHTISLSPMMNCIPSLSDDETSCVALQLDSITTDTNNVRAVDWSFDSVYLAVGLQGNPDLIQIYKEVGSALSLLDTLVLPTPSNNRLRSIRWHPTKYCFAMARRNVGGGASELFVYDFDTSTETIVTPPLSSVDLGANGWAVAWHPTKDLLGVAKSGNPEIQIYSVNSDCSLNTPPVATFDLPGGNRRTREFAFDWNKTGTFLAIGVNPIAATDDFFVLQFDVNTETFNPVVDSSISFGAQVRGAEWNKIQDDKIAIALNATTDRLRVFTHTTGSLTAFTSTGDADTTNSVAWSPNGKCLAAGRAGASGFQTYLFDVVSPGLTLVTSVNPAGNQWTVRYNPAGTRLALGNIGTPGLILYSTNAGTIIIDPTVCVDFSDVKLFLNCNVKLKNCCITFDGSSVINGQGNCLTLCPTCTLILDANSDLLIKNITIKGLNDNRIHGTDSTSTFSFKNAELVLDNDFTFSVSHFDVLGELTISGDGHTFHYETDQVSTVSTCGNVILDTGVTFRYNPISGTNSLLQFTDQTSLLTMNNATLDVIDALDLSKGIIFIDGCSTFNVMGTPAELTLGDGFDNQNNMCVHILPAGKLQVSDGTLIHKNI